MTTNTIEINNIKGLSQSEIPALQKQFGLNIFRKKRSFIPHLFWDVISEPMFLLLVAASAVYLLLGKFNEGSMTIVAILIVAAISVFQGLRSSKAIEALKELTEPRVKVVRDNIETIIYSTQLVPGDIMIIGEGEKIPADAIIIKGNDLSINEAAITGESLPVDKAEKNIVYQGTIIQSGMCYAKVTATGNMTELGKIGKSIEQYAPAKTHLQESISKFVKRLAIFGLLAFIFIWLFNYYKTGDILTSLLIGLTLIMAAIPEEVPVAFSSFMALGAYRMSKLGIISRHPAIIENLGAVSVICLDKTGTITENKMEVKSIYDFSTDTIYPPSPSEVLKYAVLASEINPFDEMEKAIINAYAPFNKNLLSEIIYEYPLKDHPPMMTHVYGEKNNYTIASKGAPERIMRVCKLDTQTKERITQIILSMASKGYRVIAIAGCKHTKDLPTTQDEFEWNFLGLVNLYDPPKKNIDKVFEQIKQAGIEVKLITGDYPQTAMNIAEQVGIKTKSKYVEGSAIIAQSMEEVQQIVKDTVVFARMFPEAKLKVIEALKLNGEIVSMTGDGVNDGPALKASHIGIAMGKKGTQIARQASDIILTDDNLQKVTEAIKQGRKIFYNLKKAVRYIISIHIPIILTALLPLLFGWIYPNIFTPIHIIFLELIMGPTCSIFFENEPEQLNIMQEQPRKRNIGLFTKKEVMVSVMQGLVITAAILGLYYYYSKDHKIEEVRSIVFTTLLISNIFLTFTNRSFTDSLIKTIRYKNNLAPIIFGISVMIIGIIHLVPSARSLFEMSSISAIEFSVCIIVGIASVLWLEIYKLIKRKKSYNNKGQN